MSELQAGRELDVQVAKDVMKWAEVRLDSEIDSNDPSRVPSNKWLGIKPGENFYREVPEFGENISAAWEVFQHMKTKPTPQGGVYWYSFVSALQEWCDGLEDSRHVEAVGDWLEAFLKNISPEVICRAALKAVVQ